MSRHNAYVSNYRPARRSGDDAPANPFVLFLAGSFVTIIVALIVCAVGGFGTDTSRRLVLNLGEERTVQIDPDVPLLVTDDCHGCASANAWRESPNNVPGQWHTPQTWARNMHLSVRMRTNRFQYWYFHMRNGSLVEIAAHFTRAKSVLFGSSSAGRLLTVVLEDRELDDAAIHRAAEDLWNTRFFVSAYPDAVASVSVDSRYPHAVVVVLVANDYGHDFRAKVDLTVRYVSPDREFSPQARSAVAAWSVPVLMTTASGRRLAHEGNVPAGTTHLTISAPRAQGGRSTDTVNVRLTRVYPPAEHGSVAGPSWNDIVIVLASIGVGLQYFNYLQRRPAYLRAHSEWKSHRLAPRVGSQEDLSPSDAVETPGAIRPL